MGEYQVDTAGVDVERLPEVLHAHCRTLDMPARTARAEGGLPEVLAGLARLPEDEVARVLLRILVDVDSRSRLDPAQIQMAEDAVPGKACNPKVGRAVADIGVALRVQLLNQ